jgi:ArsR family transcriptional regulator, lead/cadmium/zinc/bismuth-responsive transcriptional repressor
MNKSRSSKAKVSQAKSQISTSVDAPGCDTYLVHLDNVRLVQPEIVSIEQA